MRKNYAIRKERERGREVEECFIFVSFYMDTLRLLFTELAMKNEKKRTADKKTCRKPHVERCTRARGWVAIAPSLLAKDALAWWGHLTGAFVWSRHVPNCPRSRCLPPETKVIKLLFRFKAAREGIVLWSKTKNERKVCQCTVLPSIKKNWNFC